MDKTFMLPIAIGFAKVFNCAKKYAAPYPYTAEEVAEMDNIPFDPDDEIDVDMAKFHRMLKSLRHALKLDGQMGFYFFDCLIASAECERLVKKGYDAEQAMFLGTYVAMKGVIMRNYWTAKKRGIV